MRETKTKADDRLKSRFWVWTRWLIGLALIGLVATVLIRGFGEVQAHEFELSPVPLALATIAFGLYFLLRGVIWHVLMTWNGVGTGPLFDVTAWLASVIFGKYIPGKVMLFAGRIYWYRNAPVSKLVISACFMLDVAGTFISAALIVSLLCLISPAPELQAFQAPALTMAAVCLPLMHPKLLQTMINWGLRLIKQPPIEIPLSFGQVLLFTLMLGGDWIFMGMGAYFLVAAVIPLQPGHLLFILAAFVVSSISGMLAIFSPSGLGVREGVFTLLLTPIFSAPVAVLLSLLCRLWMTAVEVAILGLVYALYLRYRAGETPAQNSRPVDQSLP